MREYRVPRKYLIKLNSGSDGVQEKYFRNGYWYKVDSQGREGLVEHICSIILRSSSLPMDSYVYYEMCMINGKVGCRSKSFLRDDEVFVSFNSLCRTVYGTDLSNVIMSLRSSKERLDYLLMLGREVGLNLSMYFKRMLYLDMLIQNRDRHIRNYGVVYSEVTKRFREAPIFDNGLSLNTGLMPDARGTFLDDKWVF